MASYTKKKNTCLYLVGRQIHGAGLRGDLKILRSLIQESSSQFQQVWEKSSKGPIGFDCQHLFFDKFRTCYTCNGRNGKPEILYKLPPCRTTEKIESAVVFESPLDQGSYLQCHEYGGHSPSLLGVTAHGWLMRYSIQTGKQLQSVYLSTRYKFKHIMWETDLSRIVIKSVHFKSLVRTEQSQTLSTPLMYLAVFRIAPLEVLTVMRIDKDVFGQDIIDATVTTGLLVTMHKSCLVRFYNFEEIIENYSHTVKLGQYYQSHDQSITNPSFEDACMGRVGIYPHGLPVNVRFTSRPTLLLQISSNHHFVSFGGNPWHYITSPKAQESVFHVTAVKGNILAQDGVLSMDTLSVEPDQAYFHADHSGRILHIGANRLSCLKLSERYVDTTQSRYLQLETCFDLNFHAAQKHENTINGFHYTSSGRLVKHRQECTYSSLGYETVQDVDYEDKLDLLVVLSSHDSEIMGCVGRIGLYDNQTGVCVKEIFVKDWDQDSCHSIMMERNVICHIFKSPLGKFSCHVYRLVLEEVILR